MRNIKKYTIDTAAIKIGGKHPQNAGDFLMVCGGWLTCLTANLPLNQSFDDLLAEFIDELVDALINPGVKNKLFIRRFACKLTQLQRYIAKRGYKINIALYDYLIELYLQNKLFCLKNIRWSDYANK